VVFRDSTIRQTVKVSLASQRIRVQISNAFGGSDLPISYANIALPTNNTAGISGIQTKTIKRLTFSGNEKFIVPNGAVVFSDPIDFPVVPQSIVTISIYLADGQTTNSITSHPGSRTTSYFLQGDHASDEDLPGAAHVEHWYFVSAIEGYLREGTKAIAFIGDSITDGRGSTNNENNRWPDQLLSRMQQYPPTQNLAIVNQAAGGNRILNDGLGPNALSRIDRDILAHSGIGYVIIFEGVNDIGTAATDNTTQHAIGDRLIAAYEQMIVRIHRFGIPVFGATITPMSGPNQTYSHPEREKTRQRVNEWIRTSKRFDAVIDLDAKVRNATQVDQLSAEYNTGDYLHLNPTGYKAFAEAVDLDLFEKFQDGVKGVTKRGLWW
jgi:lysophospholipase L1-like esterase